MNKIVFFAFALLFIAAGNPALSQRYRSASDTVKLNKEWVDVSNEVAELTSKLTIAQNNLPGYNSKADKTAIEAQEMAQKSSDQAYKATNGDLDDAKTAKKKAKKALNDAEDADDAKGDVKDQQKKIDKLTDRLQKKQRRLTELDGMRTAIRAMHP